jgi:hypothetical protein
LFINQLTAAAAAAETSETWDRGSNERARRTTDGQ